VIVGFDGSSAAKRAVDLAADEAVRRGTPLEVLHALEWIEFGTDEDRFGQQLRENAHNIAKAGADRARLRHPRLDVLVTVDIAAAVDVLEAASDRAALLVVGSRGLGGFAGLLMGSVSLPVAAVSRCPLLVVHPENHALADGADRPVVVGVSDAACTPALDTAFAQARALAVPVHALHTWNHPATVAAGAPYVPVPWTTDELRKAARVTLEAAVGPVRAKYPQVEVVEEVVLDTPAHALVTASGEAALVVLAVHRKAGRFGPNLGRVSHAVLHHARSPVLLVPAGR
jgi:nucleotide-binding universal stress UspA family protein